ncbi:tRNA uracil 4-sulfurtransferase ThiI [Salinicoccus roseus]|uniref:Probable tRNA sulfurtransferase n=1 Tax=Salinicoccus roseus TaxID=45670 RepID=A0A0C2HEM6_9STAP|nr:tRNA uracil 4-sulfurtransferase ThiI [Salinicoccus roseus]KIH70084.1 thiamine biosynthesis protein ThiI [Salinicoccus roseus]MDB0581404.1 tRNA 4-thiouridine(8) synthase ThiI [Salinicoccus roseus]
MIYDHILVRYGEITLKTRNRKMFINALRQNMKRALTGFSIELAAQWDRAYITLNGEDPEAVMDAIENVNGILSVSPVAKLEKSEEAMKETAVHFAEEFTKGETFKIEVRRADKSYHLKTFDIQYMLGGYVLENVPDLKVDVKHPDHQIMVEVRTDGIYMYHEVRQCIGGLPIGTGGRALLMLSGGIDSPVAGLEVMKKGIEIEAIHFHSPPYTSPQATEKVKQLVDIMSKRTGADIKLHIVPFTELQTKIYDWIPDNMSMTTTRRIMLIIAERLAERIDGKAIVNGENLGQVASQTLTSMHAINAVTNFPVLRPLLTLEKNEIVEMARRYGTYETSVLPYEDCCTIFKPKSPKTRPLVEKVEKFESKVDFEPMIEKALEGIECYSVNETEEKEAFSSLL